MVPQFTTVARKYQKFGKIMKTKLVTRYFVMHDEIMTYYEHELSKKAKKTVTLTGATAVLEHKNDLNTH